MSRSYPQCHFTGQHEWERQFTIYLNDGKTRVVMMPLEWMQHEDVETVCRHCGRKQEVDAKQ